MTMSNTIVLTIDSRQIGFKATAGLFYRYKEAFGTEYLEDVVKVHQFGKGAFVQQVEYRTLWVLAKTYDDSIPPIQTWLDSFAYGAFHVDDIYNQVMPILQANMKVDRKNP